MLHVLTKFVTGLVLVALLLFLPAGSLSYTNAWLFLGLLFIPMFLLGGVLFFKAPKLLEKRLSTKEKETTQKNIVSLLGLLFVVGFIVAGLDYRFGWSHVPGWAVTTASVLLLISYGLYGEVMRENTYLSRTVEIQENQKVIDTGLYSIVRHPMYAITILLFGSFPVVLGSWWSFLCFLPYGGIIMFRIRNEEKILEEGLDGYKDYKQRVKYRLFPFIW